MCHVIEVVQAMKKVPAIVGSVMVIGVPPCCVLIPSACALKAAKINMQCSLIWELMLWGFELGYNTTETTKNICCVKGED